MEDIGNSIRQLREQSPYRDLRSFAAQCNLSYEGLRKIENGDRIPAVGTTNQIIAAVDLPEEEADRLRVARDLAHAEREGLLNKGVTDEKIDEIAETCQETVEEFLAEYEMALSDEDSGDLLNRLRDTITEVLRA